MVTVRTAIPQHNPEGEHKSENWNVHGANLLYHDSDSHLGSVCSVSNGVCSNWFCSSSGFQSSKESVVMCPGASFCTFAARMGMSGIVVLRVSNQPDAKLVCLMSSGKFLCPLHDDHFPNSDSMLRATKGILKFDLVLCDNVVRAVGSSGTGYTFSHSLVGPVKTVGAVCLDELHSPEVVSLFHSYLNMGDEFVGKRTFKVDDNVKDVLIIKVRNNMRRKRSKLGNVFNKKEEYIAHIHRVINFAEMLGVSNPPGPLCLRYVYSITTIYSFDGCLIGNEISTVYYNGSDSGLLSSVLKLSFGCNSRKGSSLIKRGHKTYLGQDRCFRGPDLSVFVRCVNCSRNKVENSPPAVKRHVRSGRFSFRSEFDLLKFIVGNACCARHVYISGLHKVKINVGTVFEHAKLLITTGKRIANSSPIVFCGLCPGVCKFAMCARFLSVQKCDPRWSDRILRNRMMHASNGNIAVLSRLRTIFSVTSFLIAIDAGVDAVENMENTGMAIANVDSVTTISKMLCVYFYNYVGYRKAELVSLLQSGSHLPVWIKEDEEEGEALKTSSTTEVGVFRYESNHGHYYPLFPESLISAVDLEEVDLGLPVVRKRYGWVVQPAKHDKIVAKGWDGQVCSKHVSSLAFTLLRQRTTDMYMTAKAMSVRLGRRVHMKGADGWFGSSTLHYDGHGLYYLDVRDNVGHVAVHFPDITNTFDFASFPHLLSLIFSSNPVVASSLPDLLVKYDVYLDKVGWYFCLTPPEGPEVKIDYMGPNFRINLSSNEVVMTELPYRTDAVYRETTTLATTPTTAVTVTEMSMMVTVGATTLIVPRKSNSSDVLPTAVPMGHIFVFDRPTKLELDEDLVNRVLLTPPCAKVLNLAKALPSTSEDTDAWNEVWRDMARGARSCRSAIKASSINNSSSELLSLRNGLAALHGKSAFIVEDGMFAYVSPIDSRERQALNASVDLLRLMFGQILRSCMMQYEMNMLSDSSTMPTDGTRVSVYNPIIGLPFDVRKFFRAGNPRAYDEKNRMIETELEDLSVFKWNRLARLYPYDVRWYKYNLFNQFVEEHMIEERMSAIMPGWSSSAICLFVESSPGELLLDVIFKYYLALATDLSAHGNIYDFVYNTYSRGQMDRLLFRISVRKINIVVFCLPDEIDELSNSFAVRPRHSHDVSSWARYSPITVTHFAPLLQKGVHAIARTISRDEYLAATVAGYDLGCVDYADCIRLIQSATYTLPSGTSFRTLLSVYRELFSSDERTVLSI